MTAQVAETLYLRGERLMLFTCPLESYWEQNPPRPALLSTNTACSRGYVGTWEIADDFLYLIALDDALHADFSLENLFSGSAGRVRADWFTGTLRCPQGEPLDYFHGGFLSTFERDLLIEIDHGRVVSERVQENMVEPDPPVQGDPDEVQRQVELAFKNARRRTARRQRKCGSYVVWPAALTTLAIAASIAFPPWVITPDPRSDIEQRLGYGTFYSPPRSVLKDHTNACNAVPAKTQALAELQRNTQRRINYWRAERDSKLEDTRAAEQRGEFILGGYDLRVTREQYAQREAREAAQELADSRSACERGVAHKATLARLDYARLALQVATVIVLGAFAVLIGKALRTKETQT